MKKCMLYIGLALSTIACNKKDNEKTEVIQQKQELTYDVFETARVVNDVSQVPFIVYPKSDRIHLYSQPNEKTDFIDQPITKLETLFGESEVSNFYKIIYQVDQNLQNSKYAYVLKSDVDKDNELLLTVDDELDRLRYININGNTNDEIKSLNKIGSIELIDKSVYNTVFKKNQYPLLTNSNKPALENNLYSFRLRTGELKEIPNQSNEEGFYELNYLGFSKDFDRHFFQATLDQAPLNINSFSTINKELPEVHFQGFPVYLKSKQLVASIANDEAGVLLTIDQYNPENYTFTEQYAINLVNFNVANSKSLIWDNEGSLYLEIHHPNTNTSTKNYKKQYVKIQLNNL